MSKQSPNQGGGNQPNQSPNQGGGNQSKPSRNPLLDRPDNPALDIPVRKGGNNPPEKK